jgi:hypothetical protein
MITGMPGSFDVNQPPEMAALRDFFKRAKSNARGAIAAGVVGGAALLLGSLDANGQAVLPSLGTPYIEGTNFCIPFSFSNATPSGDYVLGGSPSLPVSTNLGIWEPCQVVNFPKSPLMSWLGPEEFGASEPKWLGFAPTDFGGNPITNGVLKTPYNPTNQPSMYYRMYDMDDYFQIGALENVLNGGDDLWTPGYVNVSGITNNQVLSGLVTVSASTDGFLKPLVEELYIDYGYGPMLYSQAPVNNNPSGNMIVNTYSLPDGNYDFWVGFRFDIPSELAADDGQMWSYEPINVTVANNPVFQINNISSDGNGNINITAGGLLPSSGKWTPDYGYSWTGDQYIVTWQSSLQQNLMFNELTPMAVTENGNVVGILSPTNATETLSIPMPTNSSMGFFQLIDVTLYPANPAPTLNIPDNSLVSNTINLNPQLKYLGPIDWASLTVNGISCGAITNGSSSNGWQIDTTLPPFHNGRNVVTVDYRVWSPTTDPDTGESTLGPQDALVVLNNLVVSNDFTISQFPTVFTAGLSQMPISVDTGTAGGIITINAYDSTGTTNYWSASGTNTGAGTWSTNWDLTDPSGNSIPLPAADQNETLVFKIDCSPLPTTQAQFGRPTPAMRGPRPMASGQGASKRIPVVIHSDPYHGNEATFFVGWNMFYQPYEVSMFGIANKVVALEMSAYNVYPQDPDGYDRSVSFWADPTIWEKDQDSFNVVSNCFMGYVRPFLPIGDYMIQAHADGVGFGGGYGTSITNYWDINLLDNLLGDLNADNLRHRINTFEVNGCESATNPDNGTALHTGSPIDEAARNMTVSTFVGWTVNLDIGEQVMWPPGIFPWYAMPNWRANWIDMGQDDGYTIAESMSMTLNAYYSNSSSVAKWQNQWRWIGGGNDHTWYKFD